MDLRRKPSQPKTRLRKSKRQTRSGLSRAAAPKVSVVRVAKVAFEELAQAFVEHNIPSQLAERLMRAAYVHETAKRVGRGWGEHPNASHIAVKTGLDRHLIRAILKNQAEALLIPRGRRDLLTRITDGWAADPEYSTAKGPRDLIRAHKQSSKGSRRSVYSLVERYTRGVSPSLVVQELLATGYVEVLPNGKLRLSNKSGHPHFDQATNESPAYGRLRTVLRQLLFADPKKKRARGARRSRR